MTYIVSPRAAGIMSAPLDARLITVPGDATTAGQRYHGTFGNDFRQDIAWNEKHELQLLHLFATARPVVMRVPDGTKLRSTVINVPAETVAVFLQPVDKSLADASTFEDADGFFDVVADDGRQRRSDVIVSNQRLRWIADEIVAPLWQEESDAAKRRTVLRDRLIAYGETKMVNGADTSRLPPHHRAPRPGDLVAPWLTAAFVDKLVGDVAWFTPGGDAIEMQLRIDVRGENVDLSRVSVLVDNLRGKEASVETPLCIKAQQYQAALGAVDEKGQSVYSVYNFAKEIGTSPSGVQMALDYLSIAPTVRDAVDRNQRNEGGVSLKLAVTGREAICFSFDKDGNRQLLLESEQLTIWGELLKAFRVEDAADGIADNALTRKVLWAIKERVLAKTEYAPSAAPAKRESKTEVKSREAAERLGLTVEKDEAAPAKRKVKVVAPIVAPLVTDLRPALTAKAKTFGFEPVLRNDGKEQALVIAVAGAVAAYYHGDAAALKRFPVLAGLLDGDKTAATSKKKPAAKSPFAATDNVGAVIEAALSKWEVDGGDDDEVSETMAKKVIGHLTTCARDVLGDDADTDFLVKCSDKLTQAMHDYDDEDMSAKDADKAFPKRLQVNKAGHVREWLVENLGL